MWVKVRTKTRGLFATYNADSSKFILKRCFEEQQPGPDGFTIDGNPIITAFVGFVFQLILKDRAPEHWLVKNNDSVLVASKFLDNFDTCKSMLDGNINVNEFKNVKGIHRYLAATIFLSDYDLNFGNFGVMDAGKKVFAKIDHDYSFKTYLDSFQAFFKRLKDNTKFNFYGRLKNKEEFSDHAEVFFNSADANNITENEVKLEQELKNKIDFLKLLKRLDNICDVVEKDQELILSYFKKQEEILATELNKYFSQKTHGYVIVNFYDTKLSYDLKTKKFTSFGRVASFGRVEGKGLSDVLLDALNKHTETIKKSSKTLNIAAEICKNKTEDCINLVDKYVKSYDEEDVQVGEASHFLNWLEVDQKISSDLTRQLKDKYCVSTANSQDSTPNSTNTFKTSTTTHPQQKQPISGATQTVVSNATPLQQPPVMNSNPQPTITTAPEQKQTINGAPQKVTGNESPLQQPPVMDSNPQPTITTFPQQKQPISGAPQKVTGSAAPFEEIPTNSEINNNSQSEEQDSHTPITTHSSKQEHFLGISTRGWIIISTCAIVGGSIGATLVATGIIPIIAAIGLIVTAVLAGAAGALTGGVIGGGMACLTKIAISKCCGEEAAAQPA
ncbi:hypothetical protein [Wolbachia endosymbiont of Folsomia candida]|uniref:hypothetical protein n=1 Tax=Wolbachia endosymbiont of Folsomia candida TaxID=169402 RepID=UPI000DBF1FAE|nr:hypothetical protein [Wolbachia endosymbiont of Folsomia candida]AWW50879.1 hypothetical protein ASM33_08530 [Wolbachia endosymbiont of Folsomia candida]